MTTSIARRPIVLGPVESRKPWGAELWLNSTFPAASATVRDAGAPTTLAELVAAEPALLGDWARRLFGDELPIFTKLLRADFPPFVHVGFNRTVERHTLLGWLAREQALLRQLFGALDIGTRAAFDDFMRIYSAWATAQAEARWLVDDDAALAERLRPFVRPVEGARLESWLGLLRRNRAEIVGVLNEIDLRAESGNLLLTPAGVIHAIFGLSHQTHPLDHTRSTLQALFRNLRRLAGNGASDEELGELVDAANLPELRRANRGAPKNEGWFPTTVGGQRLLVEPQQTSDTTYSLADFYTPFVWSGDRMRFRKGEARCGLSSCDLEQVLGSVDLSATRIDEIRRVPELIASRSTATARLSRLVDEPSVWPFFTAHQVDLDGRPGAAARWQGDHAPGVFQQLVVLEGDVELTDAHGHRAALDPATPALIPATMTGGYQLAGAGRARVLLFSVPGARAGFPHD